MTDPNTSTMLYANYWAGKEKYTSKDAMGLNPGQFENDVDDDFQTYGNRLFDIIVDIYHAYSANQLKDSTVVEIGCGMGRYALPCSKKCKLFIGVDISSDMLQACEKYLKQRDIHNFQLVHTNGLELRIDTQCEFIFTTGVFQHIILLDVIVGYIKQALARLVDNGIFMFQFMGFYTTDKGVNTRGAKITAKKLNLHLRDDSSIQYAIREISIDPTDPKKQIIIVLQKTFGERDFQKAKMINRNFRTGSFDDLATYTASRQLWQKNAAKEMHKLTFYDPI